MRGLFGSAAGTILGQDSDEVLFLGEDFMPWMVLALGAALLVGNALALIRPPTSSGDDDEGSEPSRPPLVRALVMMAVGLVASIWGLASLLG